MPNFGRRDDDESVACDNGEVVAVMELPQSFFIFVCRQTQNTSVLHRIITAYSNVSTVNREHCARYVALKNKQHSITSIWQRGT